MSEKPRLQDPKERARNFSEVSFGYSKEQAMAEAKRCIQCKKPLCVGGCPVNIDIPAFIKHITEDDPKAALSKIKEKNNLPAVCGRVCPQEDQCEKVCILGKKGKAISIGYLERYAADHGNPHPSPLTFKKGEGQVTAKAGTGVRIAVVGAGPAGLTCAADLARMGYSVTLFESLHTAGGVLMYGIPEFRLPKAIVQKEVEYIRSLGVDLKVNMVIGSIATIEELFEQGYESVFIGAGAGLPKFMGVPGENLNGVYSANEFLTRVNLLKAYKFPGYMTPVKVGKRVAVIGGGNVAMDAARCSLRLGAEVTVVYRRSRQEMPARIEEVENAFEEGIKFEFLSAPVKVNDNGSGWVKSMDCIRMELGEPDESGRRKFIPIKGSEYTVECDSVIVSIGQSPNPLLTNASPAIKKEKWGGIIVNEETLETSIPGVFAGGDIVTGAATVILAMGAGKKAAVSIDNYLKSKVK